MKDFLQDAGRGQIMVEVAYQGYSFKDWVLESYGGGRGANMAALYLT
jgi:hypothetical protein